MKTKTKNQEQIVRFEVKEEVRVITALSKFFSETDNPISEEKAIEREYIAKLDPANVCLIQANTEQAKRCLSRFIDNEEEIKDIPELEYNNLTSKEIKSRYSINYFKDIINLLKCTGEGSFLIKINTDYPATLENKHFKVILAPRIED